MPTKYSIAEQILLKIYGRASKGSDAIQMPDVILAVGQMANTLLRAQHLEDLGMGENESQNLMLYEYPKQPLVSYGGKQAVCTLPAMPVRLTRNQGIKAVATDEFFECCGIPMMEGERNLLKVQDLISDLFGQWGYYAVGNRIITTKDLTAEGKDGLYFRLVLSDFAQLSDNAPVPIPADMQGQIIQAVYQSFMPAAQPIRITDQYAQTPQAQLQK